MLSLSFSPSPSFDIYRDNLVNYRIGFNFNHHNFNEVFKIVTQKKYNGLF